VGSTTVRFEREPNILFGGSDSVVESCNVGEIEIVNGKPVKVSGTEIIKMKEQTIHKIEIATRIYRDGNIVKHDDNRLTFSTG
jgi:hypothetical protein